MTNEEVIETATMLEGVLELAALFGTWRESEEPGQEDPTASALASEAGGAFAMRDPQSFAVAVRRFWLYCDARFGGMRPAEALAHSGVRLRELALECEAIGGGAQLRITTCERS